jgi:hypothetical protein
MKFLVAFQRKFYGDRRICQRMVVAQEDKTLFFGVRAMFFDGFHMAKA